MTSRHLLLPTVRALILVVCLLFAVPSFSSVQTNTGLRLPINGSPCRLLQAHLRKHGFGMRQIRRLLELRRNLGYLEDIEQTALVPGLGKQFARRLRHCCSTGPKPDRRQEGRQVLLSLEEQNEGLDQDQRSHLEQLLYRPCNIMRASALALCQLPGIDMWTARAILNARKSRFRLGKRWELLRLRQISCATYVILRPFVSAGRSALSWQAGILLVQQQNGLETPAAHSHAAGKGTDTLYLQGHLAWRRLLELRFLAKRMPGDRPWWPQWTRENDGSAGGWFSRRTWCLSFQGGSGWPELLIGKFVFRTAQGLLCGRGNSFFPTDAPWRIKGKRRSLRPHTSPGSGFPFQGLGCVLDKGGLLLQAFYSRQQLPLAEHDRSPSRDCVTTSLYTLHQRDECLPLPEQPVLEEQCWGIGLCWRGATDSTVGLQALYTDYALPFMGREPDASLLSFSGRSLFQLSLDHDLIMGPWNLFGECALSWILEPQLPSPLQRTSPIQGWAVVVGALLRRKSLRLLLLFHQRDAAYCTARGNGLFLAKPGSRGWYTALSWSMFPGLCYSGSCHIEQRGVPPATGDMVAIRSDLRSSLTLTCSPRCSLVARLRHLHNQAPANTLPGDGTERYSCGLRARIQIPALAVIQTAIGLAFDPQRQESAAAYRSLRCSLVRISGFRLCLDYCHYQTGTDGEPQTIYSSQLSGVGGSPGPTSGTGERFVVLLEQDFPDGLSWGARICWQRALATETGATRSPAAVFDAQQVRLYLRWEMVSP